MHPGGKGFIIPPKNICKACKGKCTLKVKKPFSIDVEAGTEGGTEFRFRGQADEAPGHDTGDVVIVIKEKSHKVFKRVKEHLVMSEKVSLAEALCGFQLSTEFLDGEELVIRSSPEQVVKPGDVIVIQGKGMPRQGGQRRGDLYLTLDVEYPASIPADSQKQISDALGAPPLADAPPQAKEGKKLSSQEVWKLRQSWAQRAQQAQHDARSQGRGSSQSGNCSVQ